MKQLLENLDAAFINPLKVLKNDISSSVIVIKIDNHSLVLKRSNTKNKWHFLRRLFLQTRARKNWTFAQALRAKGFKTFEPVAFVEERFGFLRGRSYFISTYIEGESLADYFGKSAKEASHCKAVIRNIGSLFRGLAAQGFIHRDLSLGNIILLDNQPLLIDFDSMRRYPCKRWCDRATKRQQERFLENCREVPQITSEIISGFQAIFNE
jgi:tRNA A-37 threonylcarbamoyl transferase component Bud32